MRVDVGRSILVACLLCEPLLLSSSNMPLSEGLLASSNKRPRRSSLYLWRVVILSVYLTGAFSYTQARGRPDRSSLRVQWNVTGKTDRERERERETEHASELSCVTARVGDHEVHVHTLHKLAIVMPLGLLLSQRQ